MPECANFDQITFGSFYQCKIAQLCSEEPDSREKLIIQCENRQTRMPANRRIEYGI